MKFQKRKKTNSEVLNDLDPECPSPFVAHSPHLPSKHDIEMNKCFKTLKAAGVSDFLAESTVYCFAFRPSLVEC